MADIFHDHFSIERNPLIRRMSITHPFSSEERQAVSALPVIVRSLRNGDTIVREGDRPSQICAILEGFARRSKVLDGGLRQTFSFHIPGDVPDLQGLFLDRMDHDLVSVGPTRVAFIPYASVRE